MAGVEVLRTYDGVWNRKLDSTPGWFNWVWENGPNGRRPQRVRGGENVAQGWGARLNLNKRAWFADPEHGVAYYALDGGHLGSKWDETSRDILQMDLVQQSYADPRITELLETPQPTIDTAEGHVTAELFGLALGDVEITARAESGF